MVMQNKYQYTINMHVNKHLITSENWFFNWCDTTHTPLHMSLFDITYARSHPAGYLLWFHLRFLPLNSCHLLMLTVLLIISVPLWCLVLDTFCPLPSKPARTTPPEAEVYKLILLLVLLILHLISFKLFLLQLFLHSLTSLTRPFTLEFFPQHLNRLV